MRKEKTEGKKPGLAAPATRGEEVLDLYFAEVMASEASLSDATSNTPYDEGLPHPAER